MHSNDRLHVYLKNCCVACISARRNNEADTDVMVVSNVDLPQPYADILSKEGVKTSLCDFNNFCFDKDYDWSLAFYKLCALEHVLNTYSHYEHVAYLDLDVYVQRSFDLIWKECEKNICLYDICHGLNDKNYCNFLNETASFTGASTIGLTHYGGEFFAANKTNAKRFVEKCREIYQKMAVTGFVTTHGDEFITSLAADSMKPLLRNAAAYICRYWTRRYRLVSDNYKHGITILHLPAEKESGMLAVYNYYHRHHALPSQKRVWKMVHLPHAALAIRLYHWIKG